MKTTIAAFLVLSLPLGAVALPMERAASSPYVGPAWFYMDYDVPTTIVPTTIVPMAFEDPVIPTFEPSGLLVVGLGLAVLGLQRRLRRR